MMYRRPHSFWCCKEAKKERRKKIRGMDRWTLSLERCHLSFCEMEAEAYSKKKFTQTNQTNCCLAQTPTLRGAFYTCAFMLPLACWKHITLPAFLSPLFSHEMLVKTLLLFLNIKRKRRKKMYSMTDALFRLLEVEHDDRLKFDWT